MASSPHPFSSPYSERSASDLLGAVKLHERIVVADADEVRNTDFSGQYGGLYVRALSANFNLDTSSTDADDGVNVVIDGAGNHFVKATDDSTLTQRVFAAAGTLTVAADDVDIIVVDKTVAGATTVHLPSAADRTKPVRVVDGKGDAATNNITVTPVSGEKIFATVDYAYVIDSNGASMTFTPRADGTGWI